MPYWDNMPWDYAASDYAPEGMPVEHKRSYEPPPSPPENLPPPPPKKKTSPWKAALYVGVIVLCIGSLSYMGMMMMPQLYGYFWKDLDNYAFVNGELLRYDKSVVSAYKQCREYMNQDVIYPGIFVDGVHIGGMSLSEAAQALTGAASGQEDFSLTVTVGDRLWTVDSSNVPTSRNLGNVLNQAYAIGRTNTTDISTTEQTPFSQRVQTAMALRESGVNLTTTPSYDTGAVRSIAQEIAAYVNRDPVDSAIASFDFKTRTFTFSESSPGVYVDEEELYQDMTAKLELWQKGSVLNVEPVILEPTVTKDALAENFKLVSAFTTSTTNNDNRNTNINLACQAINGTALLPGETFSFNAATGERTQEKGYKEAAAIARGETIEEVGGGVCQVSSTLFNAVVRADLEIVKRYAHSWPSSYVNKGEDATVNWPDLDFKFKNNTNYPVFVIMYYKSRKVSAEIWGYSLGEGVSIDLESELIQTLPAPSEPEYVYNASLTEGQSKTTVKARDGYVVDTYKVWYLNGKETKREKIYTTTYKAYQQVIQYNW